MRKEERCLDVAPPPTLDSESIDGISPLLAEMCEEYTRREKEKEKEKEEEKMDAVRLSIKEAMRLAYTTYKVPSEPDYSVCRICGGYGPDCPMRRW